MNIVIQILILIGIVAISVFAHNYIRIKYDIEMDMIYFMAGSSFTELRRYMERK